VVARETICIDDTNAGITILVRDVQPLKAFDPIVSSWLPDSNDTEVKLGQT